MLRRFNEWLNRQFEGWDPKLAAIVKTTIISLIVWAGAKYGIPVPQNLITDNYIVVETEPKPTPPKPVDPDVNPNPGVLPKPEIKAIEARGRFIGRFYAAAKIKASHEFQIEKPGIGPAAAMHLANQVKNADIDAALVEFEKANPGVLDTMPMDGPLQNMFEWLKAHPELVKIIVALMFALA